MNNYIIPILQDLLNDESLECYQYPRSKSNGEYSLITDTLHLSIFSSDTDGIGQFMLSKIDYDETGPNRARYVKCFHSFGCLLPELRIDSQLMLEGLGLSSFNFKK